MDKKLKEKISQIGTDLQRGKVKVEECRAMVDVMLHDASACFDKAAGELINLLAEEAIEEPEESPKPFDTKEIESLNYRPDCSCDG